MVLPSVFILSPFLSWVFPALNRVRFWLQVQGASWSYTLWESLGHGRCEVERSSVACGGVLAL